jgi:hypothetical protein
MPIVSLRRPPWRRAGAVAGCAGPTLANPDGEILTRNAQPWSRAPRGGAHRISPSIAENGAGAAGPETRQVRVRVRIMKES